MSEPRVDFSDFVDAQLQARLAGDGELGDLVDRLDRAGKQRLGATLRMRALAERGYELNGRGPGSVAELLVGPLSTALVLLGLRERELPRIY